MESALSETSEVDMPQISEHTACENTYGRLLLENARIVSITHMENTYGDSMLLGDITVMELKCSIQTINNTVCKGCPEICHC